MRTSGWNFQSPLSAIPQNIPGRGFSNDYSSRQGSITSAYRKKCRTCLSNAKPKCLSPYPSNQKGTYIPSIRSGTSHLYNFIEVCARSVFAARGFSSPRIRSRFDFRNKCGDFIGKSARFLYCSNLMYVNRNSRYSLTTYALTNRTRLYVSRP